KLKEKKQSQQFIEYWLYQLLNGHSYTPETCEDQLQKLGLPTKEIYFGTMAVYLNAQSLPPEDRRLYLYFLTKTCEEIINPHGKVLRTEDDMIMVLHWSKNDDTLQDNLQLFENRLSRFIKEHTQIPIIIG